ncbi:hypothetical protein D3C78_1809680 [compost metagenome]
MPCSKPAGVAEQPWHAVQSGYGSVRAIVRQALATCAAVDPYAAKADVPGGGMVQMGAGADMNHLVRRDAKAIVGVGEDFA